MEKCYPCYPSTPKNRTPKKWPKSALEGCRMGVAIPPAQSCPLGATMAHLGVVAGAAVGRVAGEFSGGRDCRVGGRGSGKLGIWSSEKLPI